MTLATGNTTNWRLEKKKNSYKILASKINQMEDGWMDVGMSPIVRLWDLGL